MSHNTYWHRHDRGFANICDIVRCVSREEAHLIQDAGFGRISRKELQHHISWINAENDAWGSSRAVGRIHFEDVINSEEYQVSTWLANEGEREYA